MHALHDLRRLTESIHRNIWISVLMSPGDTIAEFLVACSPSNAYTEDYRVKLAGSYAAAVHVADSLGVGQRESLR